MDAKSLQFKPVFSAMIEKGGNWGAVAGTHKRAFKTVVREVWPALLLTDGEVFVPASFTQEALDEFRKKYGKDLTIARFHEGEINVCVAPTHPPTRPQLQKTAILPIAVVLQRWLYGI